MTRDVPYSTLEFQSYFQGRIALYRRATMFRYLLTTICLVSSVASIYWAIRFAAIGTDLYKWGLGLASAFFASLSGFPINEIVANSKVQLRDRMALELLNRYRTARLPKAVSDHLLKLLD